MDDESERPSPHILHVYDLPQLHTQPAASVLVDVLNQLTRGTSSFSGQDGSAATGSFLVDPVGLTRYLTSIVSSSLSWIKGEDVRDQIWAAAGARISERSGRSAMPTMLRTFNIDDHVKIVLREPSLTGDNLGLKTWTSSLLLARRLASLKTHLRSGELRVLELGAGTGLVGIAAACIWKTQVTLTDLPDIVSNLRHNTEQNRELVRSFGGDVSAMPLDWSDTQKTPTSQHQQYHAVLAADPLYSPEHPALLTKTVEKWLLRTPDARFIVELPLREGYGKERRELNAKLKAIGLQVEAEGLESGYDDWEDDNGILEVSCWWSIWKFVDEPA